MIIYRKQIGISVASRATLAAIGIRLVVVVAAAGVAMIWNFQEWMAKQRSRSVEAEGHFSSEYKSIVEPYPCNYLNVLYKSEIAWLLTFVLVTGGLVSIGLLVWLLAQPQAA